VALQTLLLDVLAMLPAGVSIEVPSGTPSIPFNPSVESDELRLRVDLVTAP
jgi:hypothetical protein